MYADPSLIREHVVKILLNDPENHTGRGCA